MITIWIVLATILQHMGPSILAEWFRFPLSVVCHQLPERCLLVAGLPMPLCSRCLGVWVGVSLSASFAWPAIPLGALRWVIGGSLILMAIEILTQD